MDFYYNMSFHQLLSPHPSPSFYCGQFLIIWVVQFGGHFLIIWVVFLSPKKLHPSNDQRWRFLHLDGSLSFSLVFSTGQRIGCPLVEIEVYPPLCFLFLAKPWSFHKGRSRRDRFLRHLRIYDQWACLLFSFSSPISPTSTSTIS